MNRINFRSLLTISYLALLLSGCNVQQQPPQSTSGVQKADVTVQTDPNTGHTVEQQNIIDRLKMDNTPGSVKHLYVIAPESGQVIIYSTVRGKVTSGNKRLSPRTVNTYYANDGFEVRIGNNTYHTAEVLEDDGTYGSSVDYIFWFDAQGRYHQHFFTGGQIIHVSDYPVQVKNVVINLEMAQPQIAQPPVVPAPPAPSPEKAKAQPAAVRHETEAVKTATPEPKPLEKP